MSTASPVTVPSIPTPNEDPASIVQSVMALKQNVEIAQGTRGARAAIHPPSATNIAIGAAISAVTRLNP
jgi:hypothetical protein